MSEITYEEKLEMKLISDFKKLFYEKMGYKPVVISRYHKEIDPSLRENTELKPLNLRILKEWFEEITPFMEGSRVPLDTKKRNREIVQMRMIYCFIARLMGHSFVKIGKTLSRDHSTIMHNVETFKNLLETNPGFRGLYKEIFKHLKEKIKYHDAKLLECSNQTQDNNEPVVLP